MYRVFKFKIITKIWQRNIYKMLSNSFFETNREYKLTEETHRDDRTLHTFTTSLSKRHQQSPVVGSQTFLHIFP